MKNTDGVYLSELGNFLVSLQQANIEIKTFPHLADHYFRNSIRVPFLSSLIEYITNRFKDNSVLAAFDVFDPNELPDDSDSLAEYGNTDITTLSDQSQGVVTSTGECLEEWIGYHQFLKDAKCTTKHSMKHRDVIKDPCNNATTAALFINMSKLAKIC